MTQNIYAMIDIKLREPKQLITVEGIFAVVCKHCKVDAQNIYKSGGRYAPFVLARQIAILICLENIELLTTVKLGKIMGFDHSSIIHSRDTIITRIDKYYEIRYSYMKICNDLKIKMSH